ncbi:MAG: PAS domain S-box protein [Myxococcales bacterium]|nr:PAS domain S-box protein [Myxococcales bacterium]
MVWSAGPDGRCDYVNASWTAFTGRELDETRRAAWHDLVHPDDHAQWLAVYGARHARREGFEAQVRLRRHDGVHRTVLARGAPRADGAGFVVSCVQVDADMSDIAEFFDVSIDHLCVAGFDGYWKRLNASWTRTLGWTPEEMMSRPLIDFVHPEDREATLAARRDLTRGEPLFTLYNRYRCKDGSYRWLGWRSVAVVERQLVYAAARDVTAEREAQHALQALTESLSATLNSIADGVIATDATGLVVRMNPVAEALTGWSSSAAIGRPLREVFDVRTDAGSSSLGPVERNLEEGLAVESREHTRLFTRGGLELPVAFSRAPMRDADGVMSGAVIVFRDMSSERQSKQERERLQRQLAVAERMASVGTLAAGAAHEINNPLAYIMTNLDLITEDLRAWQAGLASPDLAECLEMAAEARHGVDRIRKIVRGLKTFARAGEEEARRVVDVVPILERSIDMAFNEVKHRARLVTDLGPIPPVEADDSSLGQVFVNLLVNAVQALPEGHVDSNEIRIVTSTDPLGAAVVEVHDTGPGVPREIIDRIFDPFFTTKPVGVGTGLGLSVCHNIVSGLGGQISVTNGAERGALFRVRLPAADGSPASDAPITPAHAAQPVRATVLIVDDEPAIGASLARVLRDHDVTAVTSAREAFALATSGAPFDLILSDLMMPEMSGMELYDALVLHRPSAAERVVFITGGAFTPGAAEFLEQVPNERLYKPFDADALRALVRRFVTSIAGRGPSAT